MPNCWAVYPAGLPQNSTGNNVLLGMFPTLGMTSVCLPVLQLIALMACNNAASSLLMCCLAEATTVASPVVQLFMARRASVLMHCSAQCLCRAWPAGVPVASRLPGDS